MNKRFFALTVLSVLFVMTDRLGEFALRGGDKPLSDYDAIVIGDFTVEQNEMTKEVPESATRELQKAVVKAVKKLGPFKHVIDKAKDAPAESGGEEAPAKHVVLSGTIISFEKGSTGKRFAGTMLGRKMGGTKNIGLGVAHLTVRYSYKDAETGTVIGETEHKGKFSGVGGDEKAAKDSAKDVGNDVIGDLHKLRGWARK